MMAGSPLRWWIPKQYGAWAMMLAPILTGIVAAGIRWQEIVLFVAWISAYLGYMAVRNWLPRHKSNYVAPMVTYVVLCVSSVVTLLVWRPALLWWAAPLVVFVGASLALVLTGRERSVLNDAFLITASCLMTVVAATARHLGPGVSWESFTQGSFQKGAWVMAGVFAGYFWGTIFYVKTMIRERGKTSWYVGSVVYHVVYLVPAFMVNVFAGLVAVLIAARAAVVPKRWPKAKPAVIGVAEICITVLMMVVLILTVPLG